MKVCEKCGNEISTPDGVNRCKSCESGKKKKKNALSRKDIDQVMRDCGMVKVKGAMGGTYYE